MHWIQNLKSRLFICFISLTSVTAVAQVNVELSYNPGISGLLPVFNANPAFTNASINFIADVSTNQIAFFGGLHFINRGSGARVAVIQNGSIARFQRESENYYNAHIPLGIRFKNQGFYIDAALAIDQFLFYNQKIHGNITSRVVPIPEQHQKTLFGLHLEGGLIKSITDDIDLKAGLQISNTFSNNIPQNYLNINVSLGAVFNFGGSSEDSDEDLDDDYEY